MGRKYRETCIVSARGCKQPAAASDDTTCGSCSGVILDWKRGLLVTHASFLMPFVDVESSHDLKSILCEASKTLTVSVLLEEVQQPQHSRKHQHYTAGKSDSHNSNARHVSDDIVPLISHRSTGLDNVIDTIDQYFTSLVNIDRLVVPPPHHSSRTPLTKQTVSYQAQIKHIWSVNSFAEQMSKLMPASDGWAFTDDISDSNGTTSQSGSHQHHSLLAYFVLIQITNWDPYSQPAGLGSDRSINILQDEDSNDVHHVILRSERLQRCDTIYVVGTPYGMLSPPVFLNSVSKGIVCNVSGKSNSLILIDARCIPGSEGGAVYAGSSLHRSMLAGIVVAALCWKQTEWVGMSIACSISEILRSLSESLTSSAERAVRQGSHHKSELDTAHTSPVHRVRPPGVRVCLVLVAGSWGSGILVSPHTGLILTCAHVINFSKHTRVRVCFAEDGSSWHEAKPIYCSTEGTIYDVALLQLPGWTPTHHNNKPVRVATPQAGDSVSVVGHGCFNEKKFLSPTITSGVISKVINHDKDIVMIQTSCGVVAGASGGALISPSGALIGLVTCNTKDTDSGASYPHVNMAVPVCALWPAIQSFLKTKDEAVLKKMKVEDTAVVDLWSLKAKSNSSSFPCKL